MAIKIQDTPNRLAVDARVSQDIREALARDPQQGLKEAARQFETLFLQMVMKSMRDATPQDGLLDSDQTRFYTGLLDQQLAQNLASGKGLGFARLIEEQLGQYLKNSGDGVGALGLPGAAAVPTGLPDLRPGALAGRGVASLSAAQAAGVPPVPVEAAAPASARDFVNRVWPHAVEASRSTGIPPQFLVAHAALESGWGRSEPRRSDGSGSYNLFGIKAGRGWTGATVEAQTTEYVDGVPQQVSERFRAYGSYAEAFQDYAALLRNNPRYGGVIGSQDGAEFARRLQQAGYATDPAYAEKLSRIISGPTLRQALIG